MENLTHLSDSDHEICGYVDMLEAALLSRTLDWADINTGSWNRDGLERLAPRLAEAFSALEGDVALHQSPPFETVSERGEATAYATGPVLTVTARPNAPVQVVMSGHYDTVFPPGTFDKITDMGNGRLNGPGLADMKGGISIMLGALQAFEAKGPKDQLGYQIVLTPDEEIGNFASADALIKAAKSGAMVGMTYEPCMDDGAMAGGRKGSAVYDIVLRGRSTHAGRAKAEGRSAIEAAAHLVLGLEALNGQREGVTVNVGKIDGGSEVNIVPDLAIVRFGARAPDEASAAWAAGEVKALLEAVTARPGISGHVHGGFYRPPKPRNGAQQALFDAVAQTGAAMGLSLDFVDTGGVCEGNNIFAAGVPNVDTLGALGGRIHSSEEYMIVDSLVERAKLSALLLNRFSDGRIDAAKIKAMMG